MLQHAAQRPEAVVRTRERVNPGLTGVGGLGSVPMGLIDQGTKEGIGINVPDEAGV